MKKYKIHLIVAVTLTTLMAGGILSLRLNQTSGLSGSSFNASRIIDDGVFFNSNTMNPGDIQNFLNAKVPTCDTNGTQPSTHAGYPTRADWGRANGVAPPYTCLRHFVQAIPSLGADAYCEGIGGGTKSAADIIYNVARACNINPQALIVLLQKEQSLISDDWPWPIQYRTATGYGCPDTAPCDAEYYGFFNQVYNAARQFRRYVALPGSFNYAIGRNSYIAYNPNAACGGSNVTIQTQATAALYNYTPYQPNGAALNNLYGTGDGCSAYGNRNFWRMFNDWFGSTLIDGFTIAIADDGNPAQYVLFGGIKQAIPDPETKIAWALQNIPLVTMPASHLASIPNGPYLDRLTRLNTSDQTVFFMDNGKRYRVMSQAMFNAWNFSGRPITNVPPGLFYVPADGGELTYSIKDPGSATTYMLDGANGSGQTVIRAHQNETIRKAWEGESLGAIPLSANFFDQINNALGTTITTTKASFRGNEYQIMSNQKLPQPGSVAGLYPGVAQPVSDTTFWRLAPGHSVTHLARSTTGPEVYLIDSGTKHHLLSPNVLRAWIISGTPILGLSPSYLNSIPNGSSISSYLASSGGQLYIIEGAKMPVPSSLDSAYRNSSSVYAASSTLLNLFNTTPNQALGIIKARSSPSLYLLDNSGKKRHLEWADKVMAWGGYHTGVMELADYIVNDIANATSPGVFVSDGTTEYVMDKGQKWTLTPTIKSDWGLSSPQVYADGTLTRFAVGGALDNKLRDGNGGYFLITGGNAYGTTDANIAQVWSLDNGQMHSTAPLTSLLRIFMLTRFVRSTTDSRTFVINNGQWHNLSAEQRANLGHPNEPTMMLNPNLAPNTITDWASVVVKDSLGKHYVIDGGGKRTFAHPVIQNHWTGDGTLTVPVVSGGFLNLLPTRGPAERAIKGSGPSVYSAEKGTKRHIQYPNTYNQFYAPFVQVTDQLIQALPTGAPL